VLVFAVGSAWSSPFVGAPALTASVSVARAAATSLIVARAGRWLCGPEPPSITTPAAILCITQEPCSTRRHPVNDYDPGARSRLDSFQSRTSLAALDRLLRRKSGRQRACRGVGSGLTSEHCGVGLSRESGSVEWRRGDGPGFSQDGQSAARLPQSSGVVVRRRGVGAAGSRSGRQCRATVAHLFVELGACSGCCPVGPIGRVWPVRYVGMVTTVAAQTRSSGAGRR